MCIFWIYFNWYAFVVIKTFSEVFLMFCPKRECLIGQFNITYSHFGCTSFWAWEMFGLKSWNTLQVKQNVCNSKWLLSKTFFISYSMICMIKHLLCPSGHTIPVPWNVTMAVFCHSRSVLLTLMLYIITHIYHVIFHLAKPKGIWGYIYGSSLCAT